MRVIPILPIFKGESKIPLDKQKKKEYNTKCKKDFKEYLEEELNSVNNNRIMQDYLTNNN